ncbi:BglG family transcription antiterminator [Enterococcus sp. UD-01]|uniref:BglG family transcription antiterminator n=1 Tax=Enterococcus sp. UD-01 TaxID=3373911 RepID=UPI00384E658A
MSLNKKEIRLIKLLLQRPEWLAANYLAEALSISTRTVRNYITRINQSCTHEIIQSSRSGYKIVETLQLEDILAQIKPEVATPKDRLNYLMNLLIQNQSVDYFEVAENLFVSIPTIEKDIIRLRKKLADYHLKIIKQGQLLHISGDEASFRKLASSMLEDEALQNVQSTDYIQSIFPEIPVDKIQKIVVDRLSSQHIYVNGYAINSLLLHIVIAVNRLLHQQRSELDSFSLFSKEQVEYQIALLIGQDIQSAFAVEMDLYEINNLTLLLMTKVSPANESFIRDYMSSSIYSFVAEMLQVVAEKYFISHISDELVLNLALHVSNLISRAQNGKQVHNPLAEEIKQSYPFIYEIAVFIAKQIQQQIAIPITDDEITFIALHIGAYFEEKFETEYKLSCVIYTPEYYDMHQRLIYKISDAFKSSLTISGTFYRLDAATLAKMRQADLVLSTIDLKTALPATQISPFGSEKDFEKIQEAVTQAKQKKNRENLKESVQVYLNAERFEKNIYLDSPEAYIEHLSQPFIQTNYIDTHFVDLIKEREKMSATSFNNAVALPHAVEMSAKKTGISIILNDHPVQWDKHSVQVIIMIVVNQADIKEFRHLFDFMIETFSDRSILKRLLKIQTYTEFIEELFK